MSISSALQTGVSGLQANSTAVGGISENIANANTVGYRRGFAQMVTTTAGGGTNNGVLSVVAEQGMDINRAGGLISTTSATDLAIGGNGFFVVSVNPNETVQTNYHLTRAGSFLPDQDGNLRNAAGFYLSGFPYDANGDLGTVDRSSFGSMETVNVGNVTLSAAQTTEMSVVGNLPAQDTGLATPGAPFETSSEFFTGLGESQRISFSWQPTSTANQWDVSLSDQDGNALGTVTVDFNDSGSLSGSPSGYSGVTSSAVAPAAFAFDTATGQATITLNNGTTPQTIQVDLGEPGTFSGITQFAGDFSQSFERDGSSVGQLIRTEIDEAGTLFGVFDNGMRRPLYQIPVAVVDNPNGLIEEKGNAYSLAAETGAFFALVANSGSTGSINSSALEGSNVDIAQEMTDLIRVQRAFSVNARVITTADDMLDETTRLKR
ncbi:flagellar hook protein FlgE [Cognatishimia activa]|uniref:Flagellar hook protein FlgE n=1 Tax=Cognatishimia activa TaxID=1715691 RepID=A0A0P1IQU3_9RHOB|nr:flagellar hook-basal body complex protein [Cognatishimia activa]CUI95871.1 Flagellar hook protein FlgE [Cognatishimia activa]CUK25884.1 Flagellar hook protein FlgE [Cognatishimia activa]